MIGLAFIRKVYPIKVDNFLQELLNIFKEKFNSRSRKEPLYNETNNRILAVNNDNHKNIGRVRYLARSDHGLRS